MLRLCLTLFQITQEMTIDNVPFTHKENGQDVVTYRDNVPRGIRSTLQERGLWREGLRGKCQKPKGAIGSPCESQSCCAETLLANQPDFLEQECKLMTVVKAAGHLCLCISAQISLRAQHN